MILGWSAGGLWPRLFDGRAAGTTGACYLLQDEFRAVIGHSALELIPFFFFFCHLFQILPKVLPQVQSELSEECGQSEGHAQIPGNSSVQKRRTTACESTAIGTGC